MKPNSLSRLNKLWERVAAFYIQKRTSLDSSLNIGIHDRDHIYRVWKNVKRIEQADSAARIDYELVQAAAILHDIGYADAPEAHVQRSVAMSKDFLQELLFSEEEIAVVQETIGGHHNNQYHEMSPEQKILLVADQLDLLGLDGMLREFIRAASKGQNRDEIAQAILQKSSQRYAKLAELRISEQFVTEKWRESEKFLSQIIATGPQNSNDNMENNA
jgi:HD superfamily phosphodiesterase